MSFYTDDFYQDGFGGGDAEDSFVCINCGGTESYSDSTGLLCCASCFTQSQTQQESHHMEIEEVQGLAAKTRGGTFKSATTKSRKSNGGGSRKKQDLSELDTSVAFPNLVTCLHGIQRVLQVGSEQICDLVGIVGETQQQRQAVQKIVHNLWRAYLVSWTDGADYYGKLHPEVRFSMRDAFVTRQYKNLVMRHLSNKCTEAIKKEEQENETEETRTSSANELSNSNVQIGQPDDTVDMSRTQDTEDADYKQYQRHYSKITSMLKLYGKKGRKEAALRLQPSMTLCASILWLAVSRTGVTCHNVTKWIANGSLTLLNAFGCILNDKERKTLEPISNVFQLQKVPSARLVEFYAQLLVVACGKSTYKHLFTAPTEARSVKKRKKTKIRLLHPDSVPLMAARFVSELGLGQDVLDTSLALMGCYFSRKREGVCLPACLEAARPENLTSPAHVLAVIFVACKMCGAIESWSYRRPGSGRSNSQGQSGPISIEESDNPAESSNKLGSVQDRFVPWNEQQFRLVGNGPMMEGYLDFLEDTYLNHDQELSGYKDILSSLGDDKEESEQQPVGDNVVRPHPILAGGRNNPTPASTRRQNSTRRVKTQKRKGTQNDSVGPKDYIVYENNKDPRPIHTHYRLLMECMAYKADVAPSDIEAVVAKLDKQISASLVPKPNTRLTKKQKTQVTVTIQERRKRDDQMDTQPGRVSAQCESVPPTVTIKKQGCTDFADV